MAASQSAGLHGINTLPRNSSTRLLGTSMAKGYQLLSSCSGHLHHRHKNTSTKDIGEKHRWESISAISGDTDVKLCHGIFTACAIGDGLRLRWNCATKDLSEETGDDDIPRFGPSLVEDDMSLIESDLLLVRNKIHNLESSNKTLHAELAAMCEELKSAKEGQKATEDAARDKEVEHQKRLEVLEKIINCNLVAIAKSINDFVGDIYGPQSPEVKMLAGQQLPLLREYYPKLKAGCLKANATVQDEDLVPKDANDLLEKVDKLAQYISHWRLSAARSGINRILVLVKAHHSNMDLATITSGLPELKADDSVLEKKEFHDIVVSLRGMSTIIASKLCLDKFFYAYDALNNVIKASTLTRGEKTPTVATPNVTESSRSKSPTKA